MKITTNWFRKRIEFEKQERLERIEILKEHSKKWGLKTQVLHRECEEDGGHEYRPLPENGFNRPNHVTGEWPEGCRKCRKRK